MFTKIRQDIGMLEEKYSKYLKDPLTLILFLIDIQLTYRETDICTFIPNFSNDYILYLQ